MLFLSEFGECRFPVHLLISWKGAAALRRHVFVSAQLTSTLDMPNLLSHYTSVDFSRSTPTRFGFYLLCGAWFLFRGIRMHSRMAL